MRQITSAEFKQAVNIDPAWASTITEPIEITDYCDMKGSNISHLSPLLTFRGKDYYGNSADFYGCKNLKIATGNFKGYSSFSHSGIEKIENLKCEKHKHRKSANFDDCKTLKIKDLSNKIIEQAINQKWVGVDFKNELKKRLILARIRESAIEIEF